MRNREKFYGCLIGGAAGDALGYAVEFDSIDEIFAKYGNDGITSYALCNGEALISDDTQMTLFTAHGLVFGEGDGQYLRWISRCYKDWLRTQVSSVYDYMAPEYSWLGSVDKMNNTRAPGNTCVTAISQDIEGSIALPLNESKGCGGIMRVAPIGLYFDREEYSAEAVSMLAAEAAALTHGHELGYIPAAFFAHIINTVTYTDASLSEAVTAAKASINEMFPDAVHLKYLNELVDMAVSLSHSDVSDIDAITALGEGWVAEETLAIAVYCALKYQNDFEKAIIAAVNHSGDSDSTGAVTGNILGAYLGISAIPEKFLTDLELRDVITKVADELLGK